MSEDRTYKQRDNYATGGFCTKRAECKAYLSNGVQECKDCFKQEKANK